MNQAKKTIKTGKSAKKIKLGRNVKKELNSFLKKKRPGTAKESLAKNDLNVTLRKQAESQREAALEALRNSEENFRRSLEDSPLGVRIVTVNGETIYANKMLLDIYGYANVEELNKTPLKERYTPQSYAEFRIRKKVREDGDPGPSEYEIAIVRKNKEIRHLQVLRKEVFWNGARQFQVIYQDITERKQAESEREDALMELRESEEKFRKIFEDHAAVKLLIEPESGAIIDANKAAVNYYGWTRAELKRMHIQQINVLPAEQVKIELKKAQQQKDVHFEFRHRRADGSIRDVEVFSSGIKMAGKNILHSIIQDITERKRAEVALRISERRYRVAEAMGHVGNWEYNLQTTKFWGSDEAKRIYGFDPEALDFSTDEVENCIPERERVHQALVDLIEADKPYNLEFEIHPKNTLKPRIISSVAELKRDEHGNPLLVTGFIQDITARKRAEEELQFRNVLLTTQQEVSIDGILVVDENARILSYNRRFVDLMGLPPKLVEDRIDEPVLQFVTAQMADPRSFLQRVQYLYEHRLETSRDELILADGRFFDRYSAPLIGSDKRYFGRVWYFRDITERKRAEMEIARVNRALQMLSDTNQALIHVTDEEALLNEVCRITVDVGGYCMTWVGFAEHDEEKTLRPVAHAGFDSGYIESAKVGWGDDERGSGPGGTAIRTGKPCIARNLPLDPAFAPWREAAIQRGYKSIIALPLKSGGLILGALGIYSSETDAFDVKEVAILEELANDLAFGVTALRMQAKRDQAEEALKKSEAQLNEAQRMAHIGSWELDIVNNVLIWSDEIYRMFEIDPKTFGASYEAFLNVIHPDDREAVNLAYTSSLKTRISYNIDHRLLFPGGRVKYVHEQCETLYDSDGNPLRSIGSVQDITERQRREETLRESENRYRRLAENAQDVIYRMSLPDGKYEYVSPAALAVFGYSPEEFYKTPLLIKKLIHPDWLNYFEEQWADLIKGEMPPTYEYQFIHKSGEVRWLNQRNILVPDNAGNPIAIEGIVTEITERKRTEEALEKRLVALTRPLDESASIEFEDLFNLNDIQRLQDEFAKATGVASIITHPDGTPITKPSNFCRLCKDIIRKTDKGRANCYKSDSMLGHFFAQGPTIQPCMSGGLWDAGAGILLGGHHIANWLIGQVRDETQSEDKMRKYAREIEADESDFMEAFHEVPAMPQEQFQRIAQALFTLANQLSAIAYQNIQQARFITEHKRVEHVTKARLRLLEFANSHSMDELLTATLDEIEALTGSTIGFYHFVESDQKTLSLQNWSTNTMKNMCTAAGKGSHYDVAQAGVWVDCVHERRPVIHNDYISLPHRKGLPEGHAPIVREVVVPIFRGNLIKAIIGVGNKSTDYNEDDIEVVSQVGDLSWDITERKLAEDKIRNSLVEKEVLLKEVYHRVKNNLMVIIGLIKMQETKADNKMFSYLLQELERRIRSMALVHEGLYKSTDLAHVDLQNYIETMGLQISAQFEVDRNIRFSVQAVGVEVSLDVAIPCGLIMNELITNAYKHAFPEGKSHSRTDNCEITVIVKRENGACLLTVADNGVGLPEGFDWEKSDTLGLKLVKMLIKQINGSIELDRSAGTAFCLKFPMA